MQEDLANQSQFGKLLKKFFHKLPSVGDLVKGKVISIENGVVRIDIDGITTGVVRGPELFHESREFHEMHVGDEVEATVIEEENEQGEVELSFRIAGHQRVWDRMIEYMKSGVTISAKPTQANKGGLMMQVEALMAFMPVSQLNPDHYPRVPGGDKNKILDHLRQLVGLDMQVKVIDVHQQDSKLIVSEKAVWEDDQRMVLESYHIGDVVEGEISALTSFGAFLKFGEGLEGLIHISEIAWQRIDHPKDILQVGRRVRAQIIDFNKSKIYLSIKRLVDDPWKLVKDRYKIGEAVKGNVHKIETFGLMVKLDNDIHGLAHISELSDTPLTDQALREKFYVGETYEFEIVNIEPTEHRLGLKLAGVKGKKRGEPREEKVSEAPKAVSLPAVSEVAEKSEEVKQEES